MNWESFLKPFQSKNSRFFFNLEENESPALLRKTNVSHNTSQRLARNWASSKSGLFTLYIFWFCRMFWFIFFQFWNQHKDSEFVLILKQRGITISSSFKIYHNPMCGRSFVDLWKLNLWHCHVTHLNISSVVEFQRWWVRKSKLFGQESTCHQGKIFKKNPTSNDSLSKIGRNFRK